MDQEYMLRLYDTDMLAFTLADHGIEGLKVNIQWINNEKQALLPLDMELTDTGVLKWLQRRVIPKNRAYVAEILKTFGLSINDTKGIIDICKGLSLNDSYWVVQEGSTEHSHSTICMRIDFQRYCLWWPIPGSARAMPHSPFLLS